MSDCYTFYIFLLITAHFVSVRCFYDLSYCYDVKNCQVGVMFRRNIELEYSDRNGSSQRCWNRPERNRSCISGVCGMRERYDLFLMLVPPILHS